MPVRPLALLRRRRPRPRDPARLSRISRSGLRRAGSLRRGRARGADGRRGPGSRTCLERRCHLRRPPVARRGGHPSAGYPCQPFSVAGRRLGAADPRHLWPHVARIVGEVEPPFVFLENVAHHLRLGFPEVAGDLVGLGYRLAAGLFTAAEVGAPHRRERLFILAHREGDARRRPSAAAGRRRWPATAKGTRNRTSGRSNAEARHHDGMTLCDATRLWMTPDTPGGGRSMPPGTSITGTDAGRQEGDGRAGEPGQTVDDADGAGSQGRRDEPGEHAGERPAWPPGPDDAAGWERYLATRAGA